MEIFDGFIHAPAKYRRPPEIEFKSHTCTFGQSITKTKGAAEHLEIINNGTMMIEHVDIGVIEIKSHGDYPFSREGVIRIREIGHRLYHGEFHGLRKECS